jgi:hypothetical protein
MACPIVGRNGPCRFPPMRGTEYCFNHDPASARRRAAARRSGGRGKAEARRAQAAPAPAPDAAAPAVPPPAFDLGPCGSLGEIVQATERVARAVAAGELDSRRASLLRAILREAYERREASTAGRSDDGRPMTDEEMDYMIANDGRPPPGLEIVSGPLRVRGAVWSRNTPRSQSSPRPLTDAEEDYVREHDELPPGLRLIRRLNVLVVGPAWSPEAPPAGEPG